MFLFILRQNLKNNIDQRNKTFKVKNGLLTNDYAVDLFYNLIDLLQNQGYEENSCSFDKIYNGVEGENLVSFLPF